MTASRDETVSAAPSPEPPDVRARRGWLGISLVVVSAIAGGTTPVFARLAYGGGSDTVTVLVMRFVVGAAVLGVLAFKELPRPLTPNRAVQTVVLGAAVVVSSFGYVGAVVYIPVGLAALVFYLFPMFVAVLSRILDEAPVPRRRVIALGAAFIGVGLTAGVSSAGVDWRGIALAASGALGIAVYIFWGSRTSAAIGTVSFTFLTFVAAAVMCVVVALVFGVALPVTVAGWFGLLASAVTYVVATLCFFRGVTLIGPVQAAIVLNVEPLWAIFAAWVLLGEVLEQTQLMSAALVVGAIALAGASRPSRPG